MRHATVSATLIFYRWETYLEDRYERRACDWVKDLTPAIFHQQDAHKLLQGILVELPTCPECAALVDLAQELGGKVGQE